MFDERSLDSFLAVKDQLNVIVSAYEQASHARKSQEEPQEETEQGFAKETIADYIEEITRLTELVKTAEDAGVPIGQIQALIVTTLPVQVQGDIFELATQ